MTRVGLIARADSRGLGVQTHSFYRAMRPEKTLVIDCPSAQPLPLHFDRFPDATVVKGLPTEQDFGPFLDGLDVVYSAETFYNRTFPTLAEQQGVRTVLHLNWEFFEHTRNPGLPKPTLFAAPSLWHYDEIPDRKIFLPVPIETDRFPQRPPRDKATHFLHIVGRPAVHDRNGSPDLLDALQYVQSEITVTIKCQDPKYIPRLLPGRRIPDNVTLVIESGDTENYWDNYTNADVLVMPRRFGGLCLPCNEALGAGMPVIMPDISPNTWLPGEWLVPATREGTFMARSMIDLYTVDHVELAAKIDQFATDEDFYRKAARQAREIADRNSWDALKPEYDRVFAGSIGKAE